ncbi:MAG: tRNA pseudouridine(38-40) synthase TruA [Holosporales bacterium]|jgi:tRNA pseudouridine38-40 synthase|nr:tRNA pseudouridine(38-40) synthase TruA [Holosporales bacterium]
MRIKLTVEYDGLGFCGWQKQDCQTSVQETIELAISKVFNGIEKIELYGAGRTDSGVHATGQVAHFDITDSSLINLWNRNLSKLLVAINFYLIDKRISIINIQVVPDDFHARFSAKMRHYRYIIFNRAVRSVIHENRAWHVPRLLDESKMNEAAQQLIGTNDLSSFRSVSCGAKSPIKTISRAIVQREGDFVVIDISAKSFLHNQVRITVGTLVKIGHGNENVDYISLLLEARDRTIAGVTAPSHGLYLNWIDY